MIFKRKSRSNLLIERGRFLFCRVFDVLHVYRREASGECRLLASVEPRGARGQVRMRHFQRIPLEVRSGLEALQLLRMLRRYG